MSYSRNGSKREVLPRSIGAAGRSSVTLRVVAPGQLEVRVTVSTLLAESKLASYSGEALMRAASAAPVVCRLVVTLWTKAASPGSVRVHCVAIAGLPLSAPRSNVAVALDAVTLASALTALPCAAAIGVELVLGSGISSSRGLIV